MAHYFQALEDLNHTDYQNRYPDAETSYNNNAAISDHINIGVLNAPEFKVFPNPTKNQITIEGLSGDEKLSLLDINGRELQTYEVAGNQFSLTLDGLSKGVYFIVINSSESVPVQKRIIKN